MTFNYIANRKIDAITQSFVFNLVNLNKTAADIATLTSEADTVIAAITGLDNPLWETESVVKKVVSTSDSKKDIPNIIPYFISLLFQSRLSKKYLSAIFLNILFAYFYSNFVLILNSNNNSCNHYKYS